METKMNRMMTLATMILLAGFFVYSTATEVTTSPSSIQPTAEPKPAVSDMATPKLPTAHVSETTVTNSSQITPTTVSVNSTMATSAKPFSSTVTSPTKPKTTSEPNQTGETSAATTLSIKSTAETSRATGASPSPSTIPASSMGTTAVSSTQTLAFVSAASATTAEPPRTSPVTTAEPPRTSPVTTAEPPRTSPATETKTETTDTINQITPNISPDKQHRSNALSSASVIAIMCGVIALVILVFGGAYYFKIRNASYGRLRDDGEYGSVGNFHNPLYEH